jgi:glycolate oxidase iron-sulfur subunit
VRFAEPADLLSCVHCGLCLAACPTYLELGEEADSPRGRIHLMRALEEGRLAPTPAVRRHLDLCLGCRACESACPSGVRYGRLIEAARPWIDRFRSPPARAARRVLAVALASRRLGPLALSPLRLTSGRAWAARLARRAPDGLRPWAALAAAAPRVPRRTPLPACLEPCARARGTAVLLTGCAPARVFPDTAHAAAALLVRAGVRVVVPPRQACCGALPLHLGARDVALAHARRTAAALGTPGADWIVSTAAGCGALLREYGHLLGAGGVAVAERARDALDLLDDLGLPPAARRLDATVTVHDPCHLAHGQGVREPVRRLLAAVRGVRLVELEEPDVCCGSAGTYNLTEPAMARRLLDRKLDRIAATGASVVAAANPGCLLQLRAGAITRALSLRIEHPLDLLAAAHEDAETAARSTSVGRARLPRWLRQPRHAARA